MHTMLATAQQAVELPDYSGYLFRVVLVLGSLLVLGAGLVIAARRWGRFPSPRGNDDGITVVSTRHLEPGKRLHVIEVDGERLLLASDAGGVSLLRGLPRSDSGTPRPSGRDFQDSVRATDTVERTSTPEARP